MLLIVLALLSGCAGPVEKGVQALEEQDYKSAAAAFEEAAASENKTEAAQGLRGLGILYYETEQYGQALETFQNALERGAKQTVELYHLMGTCAMKTDENEKALEYFRSALALPNEGEAPEDLEVRKELMYNEVVCLERLARWEEARQKADAFLLEYPEEEAMQKEADFLRTR